MIDCARLQMRNCATELNVSSMAFVPCDLNGRERRRIDRNVSVELVQTANTVNDEVSDIAAREKE